MLVPRQDLVLKVEACLSLCSAARKRHNAQEAPVPRFHFHFHFVLPFYFFLYDHRCLGRPPLSPCSAAVSLSHTACLRAASMCLVRRDAERRRSPWKSAEIKRAESIAMPIGRRASPPADLADTQNRVRVRASALSFLFSLQPPRCIPRLIRARKRGIRGGVQCLAGFCSRPVHYACHEALTMLGRRLACNLPNPGHR